MAVNVPPGSFGGFRADFIPQAFAQAVDSKGYRCRWEKSILCANRGDEDLDRHKLMCTVCDNGFIYYDPLTVEALMSSVSLKQFYRTEGRFDIGTVLVTLKAEFKISFWDKLTMFDSRMRFTEVLRRAPKGLVDKLKYPALTIEKLYSFTSINATVDYVLGTDYTLDANGNILWVNPPPKDTALGVSYFRNPAYIILDLPHHIRDTQIAVPQTSQVSPGQFTEMPMQGIAKLDFLVRDETATPP